MSFARSWLTRSWLLAGAMAGALTASPALASGPSAVGMVMKTAGPVEPAVEPFTEVQDTFTVMLGDSGRLTFVHYGTCNLVVVGGGTVTIGAAAYQVVGGKVEKETRKPCPQRVQAASAGPREAGGLVMRALDADLASWLPARPSFVLAGDQAAGIERLEVFEGKRRIAEFKVVNRRVVWPEALAPLKDATDYRIVLVGRKGGPRHEVPMTVAEAPAADETDTPVVLRVE